MISITPQGQVYLCKTPLENDYKNQLTFANATDQQTYFASKVTRSLADEDFTYIKKDNIIKVGIPIDDILDCNYLFYKNTGFTTKYYYCFITNMEYINENVTAITIETDVYQTYMFDIVKKACFVEREHVNDDTIGLNTVPEKLDTGEFIINDTGLLDEYGSDGHVIIGVTKVPDDMAQIQVTGTTTLTASVTQYNGVFSGLTYFAFETVQSASNFLMIMDLEGKADDVVSVFIAPLSLFEIPIGSWDTFEYRTYWQPLVEMLNLDFHYKRIPSSNEETIIADNKTISINTTLNGYTPKNNKMFTKEFNNLYITNNNGSNVTYAYEDFINNTPKFRIIGAICPGCSIRLTPLDYKKYETTTSYKNSLLSYGLPGGKYPTCSWRSDTYTNWITQNGVNRDLETFGSIGALGLGAIINPTATLASGITGIFNSLMEPQKYQEDKFPMQAKGNTNVGDVTYAGGQTNFAYFQLSCRYEFAKKCDDYLSMFGYKVNEVKIPNTTGRLNWNYVKTIDCNFEGDIPQLYLNKIKQIFNNGITLWHNASTFLDYSQSNTIVS